MIVACPHCAAVYELPRHLLGPGGAAVRCPHCTGEFTLGPEGDVVTAGGAERGRRPAAPVAEEAAPSPPAAKSPRRAAAAEAAAPAAKSQRRSPAPRAQAEPAGATGTAAAEAADAADDASSPRAIARRVLEELAARKGPAMKDAGSRGRLLSEFGPDLVAAFELFRKEVGGSGNPGPFRDELKERWGIDLTPPES